MIEKASPASSKRNLLKLAPVGLSLLIPTLGACNSQQPTAAEIKTKEMAQLRITIQSMLAQVLSFSPQSESGVIQENGVFDDRHAHIFDMNCGDVSFETHVISPTREEVKHSLLGRRSVDGDVSLSFYEHLKTTQDGIPFRTITNFSGQTPLQVSTKKIFLDSKGKDQKEGNYEYCDLAGSKPCAEEIINKIYSYHEVLEECIRSGKYIIELEKLEKELQEY